jgi:RNA polymerase sigma factor (TIGR02999 family)
VTTEDRTDLTTLLVEWRRGSEAAGRELVAATYENLRRLAAHYLKHERRDHTLQPTDLVSELYLKLFPAAPVDWRDRTHFFAVAGRQLRRLLVDHARSRGAGKRGGRSIKVSLTEAADLTQPVVLGVVEVDDALARLEALDARAASVVELRFFSGLTETEIAEVLGVSGATVRRDWRFARAWLVRQLV